MPVPPGLADRSARAIRRTANRVGKTCPYHLKALAWCMCHGRSCPAVPSVLQPPEGTPGGARPARAQLPWHTAGVGTDFQVCPRLAGEDQPFDRLREAKTGRARVLWLSVQRRDSPRRWARSSTYGEHSAKILEGEPRSPACPSPAGSGQASPDLLVVQLAGILLPEPDIDALGSPDVPLVVPGKDEEGSVGVAELPAVVGEEATLRGG